MSERLLYEKRQWGEFYVLHEKSLSDGLQSLTKVLIIELGRSISYQRHFHRNEFWTIVDGDGTIIIDGRKCPVARGASFVIHKNQLHSIKATTSLTIIEVQIGDYLSEEDIERMPSSPW